MRPLQTTRSRHTVGAAYMPPASPYNYHKQISPKLRKGSFGLIFFLWCGLAEDLIVEQHPRNDFTICISYLTIYDS